MRTVKKWKFVNRQNVKIGRYELQTGLGTNDRVFVYHANSDKNQIYVLAVNYGLPYIGLASFHYSDADHNGLVHPDSEIFLQEGQSYETLGGEWDNLTPIYLARILEGYLSYD